MTQKQATELTVVERAALALGTSERESSLRELVAQSVTIVEIKNTAAREQCHGALMTLRTTRTDITKAGKTARDDANAFSKAVIAEEKRLVAIIEPEEARLQDLRDEWDEAREAEKRAAAEAEARRIAAIRAQIDDIRYRVTAVAGKTSSQIDIEIGLLEAAQITVERFADLTGEAEAARGETLDKLAEMFAKAREQEAEAARLAAERAELERQRAELEEQRRKDEAARAERERIEREAREAREAEERAQRERAEAARRELQERQDAERRAALEAEERRMAEQREALAQHQAELDRAEAERHAREEAAAREMAEAAAKAERDRVAREQAENRAARLAPQVTGGVWTVGKHDGCIVTTAEIAGAPGSGHNDVEYYGGNLICESVWRPADAYLLSAARDMFELLTELVDIEGPLPGNAAWHGKVQAVLAKATYVPEVQPEAQAA